MEPCHLCPWPSRQEVNQWYKSRQEVYQGYLHQGIKARKVDVFHAVKFVQPFSPSIHTFATAAAGIGLPLAADFFLQKKIELNGITCSFIQLLLL